MLKIFIFSRERFHICQKCGTFLNNLLLVLYFQIADFGLARDIYVKDYYRIHDQKNKELPVRWMSIESIEMGMCLFSFSFFFFFLWRGSFICLLVWSFFCLFGFVRATLCTTSTVQDYVVHHNTMLSDQLFFLSFVRLYVSSI